MLVAQVLDMEPYEFIWSIGDAHVYSNQFAQIEEQLSREPKELPTVTINPELKDLFKFQPSDITIHGYQPHPKLDYPPAAV